MQKLHNFIKPQSVLVALFISIVVGGFVVFSEHIAKLTAPMPLPQADGIIVLTGGNLRMETGLRLLEEKRGQRLLISGVNRVTDKQSLIRATHADKDLFRCCVDLGHKAADTLGNAAESADWVKRNGFKTVYVVTNDYHMPRSLLELRRTLPNTKLIAYPVTSSFEPQSKATTNYMRLRTIASEYVKYIGAWLRHFWLTSLN